MNLRGTLAGRQKKSSIQDVDRRPGTGAVTAGSRRAEGASPGCGRGAYRDPVIRPIAPRAPRPWQCLVALSAGLLLAAGSADSGPTRPTPQEATSLTSEAQQGVVDEIAAMLQRRYVFPDVATRCGQRLHELSAEGAFDVAAAPEAFALRLTEALREVSGDLHLLVRVRARPDSSSPEAPRPGASHPLQDRQMRRSREREKNFGFERVERLEGNVGYLDLRYFASPRDAQDTAVATMAFLEHTDALIFDLRRNGGGHPGLVHFLSSHLFDEPTHLGNLYFREGEETQEVWTLGGVPGVQRPEVPVFVLTSADTFSAAEEFGYNLQAQGRATLVGETTRGGAHPGGLFPVDATFEMIIPTGRAINPITGTNWEGTGVKPDVAVAAEEALDAALELARLAAARHRAARQALWDAFEGAHAAALRLDEDQQPEAASAQLLSAVQAAHRARLLDESDLVDLGAHFLAEERPGLAVAVGSLCAEQYARSVRAHAGLGAALRAADDIPRAIASYERVIELQPEGEAADAARAVLAVLTGGR